MPVIPHNWLTYTFLAKNAQQLLQKVKGKLGTSMFGLRTWTHLRSLCCLDLYWTIMSRFSCWSADEELLVSGRSAVGHLHGQLMVS